MAPLLTPKQAAEHLGISEEMLRALRRAGEIAYVNVGLGSKRETPRYEVEDLDTWIQRRKVVAPAEAVQPGVKRRRGAKPPLYSVIDFQKRIEERRARLRKR